MNNYSKITEYLNKCIETGVLSHAYIFHGPDETAKRETAFWLANKLLLNNKDFHPDLFLLKTDTESDLTINLIRQLKNFLTLRPYSANYKIAIIENGENLNDYAQNAMLKIFEEAPAYALIIICVKNLGSILDTIVSRGVKLSFWRPEKAKINQREEKIFEVFEKILESDSLDRFMFLEKLNNHKIIEVFKLWIKFLRLKFLLNPIKYSRILKISQNIFFKLNETNFNPKFAYDELILNLQLTTAN